MRPVQRHFDPATYAVRFKAQLCAAFERNGLRLLDQLPPIAMPRRFGRVRQAAFTPVQRQMSMASVLFELPRNIELFRTNLERAIFERVGRQFVQGERKRLRSLQPGGYSARLS